MSEPINKGADTIRQEILRAAAHQFAQRPYHQVGLDDVLAEAELTAGAVYFHFRSKYALALAVIEDQATKYMAAAQDLLTRKLSGLETLVDVAYLIAVADISEDIARAGLNLLESVGRNEGLQTKLLGDWVQLLGLIVERAAAEGETIEQPDARDVGRLLVSLYLGMRQISDLDQPEQFLLNLEKSFSLLLPGIVREDPIGDLRELIRRRTALAIESISIPADSD